MDHGHVGIPCGGLGRHQGEALVGRRVQRWLERATWLKAEVELRLFGGSEFKGRLSTLR